MSKKIHLCEAEGDQAKCSLQRLGVYGCIFIQVYSPCLPLFLSVSPYYYYIEDAPSSRLTFTWLA